MIRLLSLLVCYPTYRTAAFLLPYSTPFLWTRQSALFLSSVSMNPSESPNLEPSISVSATKTAKSVNIPLSCVKNMRDLATASTVLTPGKIFRTGCVSKANDTDITVLNQQLGINCFIDLRSADELKDDENLNSPIYNDCVNYKFNTRARQFEPMETVLTSIASASSSVTKRRYFISLMSESLIKREVFLRLGKRGKVKAVALYLLSTWSTRAMKKVRSMFLAVINAGGLKLLNEFVLDCSGAEIAAVMKLLADESGSHFPAAVYCTAGKDRTGIISMLTLKVLGATDEEVVADYVLSDAAYSELNDKKAMVAALKQSEVDSETFLRAKPEVITHAMNYIKTEYGSIEKYLDKHGFDASWRIKLRKALLNKA